MCKREKLATINFVLVLVIYTEMWRNEGVTAINSCTDICNQLQSILVLIFAINCNQFLYWYLQSTMYWYWWHVLKCAGLIHRRESCKLGHENGWTVQSLSYILGRGVVTHFLCHGWLPRSPLLVMYDTPQDVLCTFSLPQ